MKRVLITGASSGIGARLAMDYAAEDWQVLACGRNREALQQLSLGSAQIQPLCFDVTDMQQVRQSLSSQDPCELLILNAGSCEYVDIDQFDAALFARVFAVNVQGLANCLEVLLPQLRCGDRLALVGSLAGELPFPRAEAYGASKAATAYLARSLAVDLASRGVGVSLISPGFVDTPLTRRNDFAMPCLVSPEYASQAIRRGLARADKHIHFPKRFSIPLLLAARLPLGWFQFIASRWMVRS